MWRAGIDVVAGVVPVTHSRKHRLQGAEAVRRRTPAGPTQAKLVQSLCSGDATGRLSAHRRGRFISKTFAAVCGRSVHRGLRVTTWWTTKGSVRHGHLVFTHASSSESLNRRYFPILREGTLPSRHCS